MATARNPRKAEARVAKFRELSGSEDQGIAAAIAVRALRVHMPYGTIMDPIFASPESDEIVSYTRSGDSAIWTGHFLAAEAFRYRVTAEPEALEHVSAALAGIRGLVDITGNDTLSRVAAPVDSPYAAALQKEEAGHGIFDGSLNGSKYFWIGNTTRDQYSGVIFGLGVVLDLIRIPEIRQQAAELVGRLVRYLVAHAWTVWMPNGRVSTTFLQRPDQQLAFLQVARHASSAEFGARYKKAALRLSAVAVIPILYDNFDDHHSYFKFNLNTINMYSLLRFENTRSTNRRPYLALYNKLRRTTASHQNAHFNMIDHAIKGPNPERDAETVALLAAWKERPRRDPFVDLRSTYKACGDDRACQVIPVAERPTTDFVWQRSPFLLFGGGVGIVEGPGIDFTLPYWMARYFRVIAA